MPKSGNLSVLFVTTSLQAAENPRLPLRVGDVLPSRAFSAFSGRSMTIPDDVRGKVTVVHFWTDWCGSCREVMPALDAIYGKYQQKGLQIVAINFGQNKEQIKKFIDKARITYPVLMDPEKSSAGIYSITGLPRTYILDRKGIVRYKIIGEVPEEEILKFVLELL